MISRLWLNLALLFLVGILILVVVYEPGKQVAPPPTKLTQLTPGEISHIHIKRVTGEAIELARESDGQWWMYNPFYLPANEFRIQSLLRLAEADSLSNHPIKELQPATYGLDEPRAVVTFNRTEQIKFGDTEPLQQHRYVLAGEQLHTIVDTFYYQAAGSPTNFLSYRLLPTNADIVKLIIPDLQLALIDGQWQREPSYAKISADASIELINYWQHAQALELRATDLTEGKADIEIYTKNISEPIRYKLLQNDDGFSLLRLGTDLQYLIADDVYQQLLTLPEGETQTATDTP